MKEFDINQDQVIMLETPEGSTELEKEQYYLSTLKNNEWGYNKALSIFVVKVEDKIYYLKIQLIQFRCCGQPPAELVGCVLRKTTLPNGEKTVGVFRKDIKEMPFTIKDETKLLEHCFRNFF